MTKLVKSFENILIPNLTET